VTAGSEDVLECCEKQKIGFMVLAGSQAVISPVMLDR